jgi:hypothetical protein
VISIRTSPLRLASAPDRGAAIGGPHHRLAAESLRMRHEQDAIGAFD